MTIFENSKLFTVLIIEIFTRFRTSISATLNFLLREGNGIRQEECFLLGSFRRIHTSDYQNSKRDGKKVLLSERFSRIVSARAP